MRSVAARQTRPGVSGVSRRVGAQSRQQPLPACQVKLDIIGRTDLQARLNTTGLTLGAWTVAVLAAVLGSCWIEIAMWIRLMAKGYQRSV